MPHTSKPTRIWKKATGPTAGLVKRHYVAARQQELSRRNPELEDKVAEILINHPLLSGRKLKMRDKGWSPELTRVYAKINKSLQSRELTINFDPERWFTTENHYPSYSQLYERSVGSHGTKYLTGNKQNAADVRVKVDDDVTLPHSWNRPEKAARLLGIPPSPRGLRPGLKHDRIAEQMQFGKPAEVDGFERHKKVESRNPHFNPKTKQVFAALNYGRRPHGSSMQYGDCHLVLHDRFKANAMYYGRDTFYLGFNTTTRGTAQSTAAQCAYGMLAAVIAYSHRAMVDAIIRSCYFDQTFCGM